MQIIVTSNKNDAPLTFFLESDSNSWFNSDVLYSIDLLSSGGSTVGAGAWLPLFIGNFVIFMCKIGKKMANNVLVSPFYEEPRLAPLYLFKESGSAPA